jgi:hypothetical protein
VGTSELEGSTVLCAAGAEVVVSPTRIACGGGVSMMGFGLSGWLAKISFTCWTPDRETTALGSSPLDRRRMRGDDWTGRWERGKEGATEKS